MGLAKRINYDELLVLVTYGPCYLSMNGCDQNIASLRMGAGLDCRSPLCRVGIWCALFCFSKGRPVRSNFVRNRAARDRHIRSPKTPKARDSLRGVRAC